MNRTLGLQHFCYLAGLVKDLKHVVVISLLILHLFSMGGYLLVFDQLEQGVGQKMIARIDGQAYDDRELLEIRVPVNLPYQTNWTDFERIDGEITLSGVHYNYVKRKFYNDTLILLCLPNTEKTKLFNARETFFSLVNDMQQDQPAKQVPLSAKMIKFSQVECLVSEGQACLSPASDANCIFKPFVCNFIPSRHALSPEQPPECLLA